MAGRIGATSRSRSIAVAGVLLAAAATVWLLQNQAGGNHQVAGLGCTDECGSAANTAMAPTTTVGQLRVELPIGAEQTGHTRRNGNSREKKPNPKGKGRPTTSTTVTTSTTATTVTTSTTSTTIKDTTTRPTTTTSQTTTTQPITTTTTTTTTTPPGPGPTKQVGFEIHPDGVRYDLAAQRRDWDVKWSNSRMEANAVIAGPTASAGSRSLRLSYPAGQPGGGNAAWLLPSDDEYYMAYSVYFEPGFDFDGPEHSGGKLPGLGAGKLCSGGQTCDGTNGFTARYMWRDGGRAQLYLYDMTKGSGYGREVYFDDDGRSVSFQPGTWHRLVQRVRLNTVGRRNGEVEIWMDGRQVVDVTDLEFRTADWGIDTLYFSTFFGGNSSKWYPTRTSYARFDDFVVSTSGADVGLG